VNLILGEKKMKRKVNLIVMIAAVFVFGNSIMAQQTESYTYARIAQSKIQEAQKQLVILDQTVSLIEKTRSITDLQEKTLGAALDEFTDARQVAYESVLKSAEYAARTEGVKGDVQVLKQFEDFAKTANERGKTLISRLANIEEAIDRGKIKRPPFKRENSFSVNQLNFIKSDFEQTKNDSVNSVFNINATNSKNQANLLAAQNSCVSSCLSLQWGKCLPCILNLVCEATGGGSGGGGGNNYQKCVSDCNSLPFFKRVACKAKCVFS
jgi:hypothetical protein